MQAPARITSARPGCRPDNLPTLLDSSDAVELDLTADLRSIEHGALDDVGVVRREPVLDCREIRDRASQADQGVRGPAVR